MTFSDETGNEELSNESGPALLNIKVKTETIEVRCNTCCETFDTINQLSQHIKEIHLIQRKCKLCGINEFSSWNDFQQHHLQHLTECSIKVDKLGPEYTAAAETCLEESKKVAKKSTTSHSLERAPIKLTLRLTNCRKAKAAEERFAKERRESMDAMESGLSKLDKAMEELNQVPESVHSESSQLSPITSLPAGSPANSFTLR